MKLSIYPLAGFCMIQGTLIVAQNPNISISILTKPLLAGRPVAFEARISTGESDKYCKPRRMAWRYELRGSDQQLTCSDGFPALANSKNDENGPDVSTPSLYRTRMSCSPPPGRYLLQLFINSEKAKADCGESGKPEFPREIRSEPVELELAMPSGEDLSAYREFNGVPAVHPAELLERHPGAIYTWDVYALDLPRIAQVMTWSATARDQYLADIGCSRLAKRNVRGSPYARIPRAKNITAACLAEGKRTVRARFEGGKAMLEAHPEYPADGKLKVKQFMLESLLRLGEFTEARIFAASEFPDDKRLNEQLAALVQPGS